MTLIVGAANFGHAILVSDRRITVQGQLKDPDDDERNKMIVLQSDDAKFAVCYAGVARWNTFSTRDWLLDLLAEFKGSPFEIPDIVEYIGRLATQRFRELDLLTRKTLTIVMIGFWQVEGQLLPTWAEVTNRDDSGQYMGEFRIRKLTLGIEVAEEAFAFASGSTTEALDPDMSDLAEMAKRNVLPPNLVQKAVHSIRSYSDQPGVKTVGKQFSSVIISSNAAMPPQGRYHSETATDTFFIPDNAWLTSNYHAVIKDVYLHTSSGKPVFSGKPVGGRNAPCSCGSGKKWKHCHGKPPPYPIVTG